MTDEEHCEGFSLARGDPMFVASDAAEIHATLLESREALENRHEAKAALLLNDAINEMDELTDNIDKL